MKQILLFLLCFPFAWAGHPEAFSTLGGQLETEFAALSTLTGMPWIDRSDVDTDAVAQRECFEKGYALDAALLSHIPERSALRSEYLSCLRALQQKSRRWERRYASALQHAIKTNAVTDFEMLVTHPLEPLRRPSLRERAMAYYDTIRQTHTISAMETMREASAHTLYAEDEETSEEEQTVFGRSETLGAKGPVTVSTKQERSCCVFYAKNRTNFPVTLTLSLSQMKNFKASVRLPISIELEPKAEAKILDVDIVDTGKGASMLPRYSWIMGRASARHSDPLYRVPFAVGTDAVVSQGFNGGVTHNGRSCYAVDFSCPEGTKVYAARAGRVIAVESSHNRGGFEKRFRADANYIIIEHDDHTLGKYVHLKQYGAMVRVGETVWTGQFIGYSGNTGYSSGPHLHFSVSSVDPDTKSMPLTLPFRFQTAGGTVAAPKSTDIYRVVKLP